MSSRDPRDTDVWAAIEQERRRDRLLRAASAVAWTVTILVVLAYGGVTAVRVSTLLQLVEVGAVQRAVVFQAMLPFIAVVGTLSLIVAVLCTIGVFLRLRTASLTEIQLRLAALESLVREGREPGSGA